VDDVVVRPAVPGDVGQLLTLQHAAWVSEAQAHDDPHIPPLTQTLDDVLADLGTHATFVAVHGGRLVACGRVRVADRVGHVGRLGVVPDLQGRGLGGRMLDTVEGHAADGVDRFALFTGSRSEDNLRWYRGRGYVEVRREQLRRRNELVHLERVVGTGGAA
jgi:ribosomal protein S18 acetylase RimI-like enzyme